MVTEEEMKAARVVPLRPHNAPIQLSDYRAEWPALFVREAARVRATLGARVLMLEHVGSTSVPGLAAKPIIDMILAVADSADETDIRARDGVRRICAPHPRAGMASASAVQGPRHQHQSPRLLVRMP